MIEIFIEAAGVRGPGLEGWPAAREVLSGTRAYAPAPTVLPECDILPAAERRRAVLSVKLALVVATEAIRAARRDAEDLATVFTSSAGDSRTLHDTLQVLATPERAVSPTRFHNSVHNAPAGYWHIAVKSRAPSTSVCLNDTSFAAGLVEAATWIVTERTPILLVAYDVECPPPLHAVRPILGNFGAAFVLTPAPSEASMARLAIGMVRDAEPATPMEDAELERLRAANPAARSLPLLAALAKGHARSMVCDYVPGGGLAVTIAPIGVGAAAGGKP